MATNLLFSLSSRNAQLVPIRSIEMVQVALPSARWLYAKCLMPEKNIIK